MNINELEERNLGEKPWQLKGEVTAKDRNQASLLEEHLSFQYGKVSAPVITNEITEKIENIIRRRVKDKIFDDVERKRKIDMDTATFRLPAVVSSEKSKDSLAMIYEKEYLQKMSGDDQSKNGNESHEIIKQCINEIFRKLDTLTNLNYTPKMPKIDVSIQTNYPTISLEEPAPIATHESTTFAPEEIYSKEKNKLISKNDLNKEEKQRMHRKKKSQRLKRKKIKQYLDRRKEVNKKLNSKVLQAK